IRRGQPVPWPGAAAGPRCGRAPARPGGTPPQGGAPGRCVWRASAAKSTCPCRAPSLERSVGGGAVRRRRGPEAEFLEVFLERPMLDLLPLLAWLPVLAILLPLAGGLLLLAADHAARRR